MLRLQVYWLRDFYVETRRLGFKTPSRRFYCPLKFGMKPAGLKKTLQHPFLENGNSFQWASITMANSQSKSLSCVFLLVPSPPTVSLLFCPRVKHIVVSSYRSTQTEKQYKLCELGPLSSGRVHGPRSNEYLPQDSLHRWKRCQDVLDPSVSHAIGFTRLFIAKTESRAGKSQSGVTQSTTTACPKFWGWLISKTNPFNLGLYQTQLGLI